VRTQGNRIFLSNLTMINQDTLPLADILREYIRQDFTAQITVSSGSMIPLLEIGDVLGLEAVEESRLRPGHLITFETAGSPREIVTHRIASTWRDQEGRLHLLTRGDRMLQFDRPFGAEQIIGTVSWRARNGRLVRLDRGQGARLNEDLGRISERAWQVISGRPLAPYPRTAEAVALTNEQALSQRNTRRAPIVRALALFSAKAISAAMLPFAIQEAFEGTVDNGNIR
jgi:hypothetical protein